MKELSRGQHLSVEELHDFIDKMEITDETKNKLKSLTPENYTGLASELVDITLKRWNEFKEGL